MTSEERNADNILALTREVAALTARMQAVSEQLADLKNYMVTKFDRQERSTREANQNQDLVIANIISRVSDLERKNTYRGGMTAMASAIFGGIFGMLTGSGFLADLWKSIKGASQ